MELVKPVRVMAIGEAMIEAAGAIGGPGRLGHGGDTLNTAVYLARLGVQVSYLTALGRDPFSAAMRALWAEEGVDTTFALTHPDRLPGLYAIHTDDQGERSFLYWRNESAARALFACPGLEEAWAAAETAPALYLSGITLAIFAPSERSRLVDLARARKAAGAAVGFDPNYRARLWPNAAAAREAFAEIAPYVTLAFVTLEDERALGACDRIEAVASRWRMAGADEAVIKLGPDGAYVDHGGGAGFIAQSPVAAVDTTGAGDSFNAAYLAARLAGATPEAAARAGNALAREVVRHPGAIIPRAAMPELPR